MVVQLYMMTVKSAVVLVNQKEIVIVTETLLLVTVHVVDPIGSMYAVSA